MENKKKNFSSYFFIDLILLFFLSPLLIFKWIGDEVISFLKLIYKIILSAYNIYLILLKFFLFLIKSIFYYFASFFSFLRQTKINCRWPKLKLKRAKIIIPLWLKLAIIKIKYFFIGALTTSLIAIIYLSYQAIISLPNPKTLTTHDMQTTTKIYDRNNNLLYEIYANENRTPIKLEQVPEIVKKATVAIEDKEFYFHNGLSIRGIIRALIRNLTSDSLEGGSTITQQLIRSAFLTPEKTIGRKIKEIILSVWTEQLYTKDQILEMYLNQVPFGGTAWGIEAASQTYFGKSVKDLSLAQAALLAGLPAAPSLYSPYNSSPALYKQRQEEVLKKMKEQGFITEEEMRSAREEKLIFKAQKIAIEAPHFVMYVKDLLEKYYGSKAVEKGGLTVITSLDLSLQKKTQEIVSSNIDQLKMLNVQNGAALITNPKNGEILAMVGSKDYFDEENQGNYNVTTSLRQPGSSIKIVTYAAALSEDFTAATTIADTPITFKYPGAPPYSPVNYDGKFHGFVSLRTALACSYNVPAVKVLSKIGLKKMIEQGRLMGITDWQDENRFGLSLTLGGGEVTMLDMAKVYGSLANQGIKQELKPILSVTNYKGDKMPLPNNYKDSIKATSAEIAFIISSILSDNNARAPAFGLNSALVIPGKTVAVKTGTSDNKRDNWTIGYTPDFVVVVWVGNNDNSPMNPVLTSGVTGAAPIWHEVMANLLKDSQDKPFIQPSTVISIPCYGRREFFIAGTEPKGGCVMPISSTLKNQYNN